MKKPDIISSLIGLKLHLSKLPEEMRLFYSNVIDESVSIFSGVHTDIEEHNKMTANKLAEHLGLGLWVVMEISRWACSREKPIAEGEETK